MNTSQARRTFRAIICISCISVPQSLVVAQQVNPGNDQASRAHTWQSTAQPKTFSLPAVQKASGETAANNSSQPAPAAVQGNGPQLGFPQSATELAHDPIPASPWADSRTRALTAQPTSVQSAPAYSQQAPRTANPWNAPAPAISSPSLSPRASAPRFIEQPSAQPQKSPASQSQPQQEFEFEINGPVAYQGGQAAPFRTASTTNSIDQSAPSNPGFVLGSQSVPSTSITYDLNSTAEAAPADRDWNHLPNHGVRLNDYQNQNIQAPPVAPTAPVVRESVPPTSPFAPQPQQGEKAGTPVINPFVPQEQAAIAPQVQAQIEEREKLAEMVSKEVLSKNANAKASPKALENPRGWKAVEEELKARLNNCDNLLRRGATQSAREEIVVGLHSLCRAIDVRDGGSLAETSLERAMTALKEEKDFYRPNGIAESSLVAGHQTPVLRSSSTANLSPIVASQHYRLYAKNQLLNASQGHPWAAELLYALGRTYESESESNVELGTMLREQAIACYQAAIAIDRNHVDAANQLGYSLLRVDRTREAEVALATAVSISPSPQAWKNLAEVYRRDGNVGRAEYAVQQAFAMENKMNLMANGQPMPNVLQISPEQFAQLSPNTLQQTSPPQSMLPPVNAMPTVAQSAPTPNNYSAPDMSAAPQVSSKPGMLGSFKNMFR